MALSKTQIDKLGDRLKAGQATEEDLRILSEKLSDVVDSAIKYGGGQSDIGDLLISRSNRIAKIEAIELELELVDPDDRDDLKQQLDQLKTDEEEDLSAMIVALASLKSLGPRE